MPRRSAEYLVASALDPIMVPNTDRDYCNPVSKVTGVGVGLGPHGFELTRGPIQTFDLYNALLELARRVDELEVRYAMKGSADVG